MTSPRSAAALAVLVSWDWAREMEDSSKAMSSAKSKSFKTFAGYLLDSRGHVRTPESPSEDLSSRYSTKIIKEKVPIHHPEALL